MSTIGARHNLAKLAPDQKLSKTMAFVWYLSRLSARGVELSEGRAKAKKLAARYYQAVSPGA